MHILNFGTLLQTGADINVRPENFFSNNTILDADMIFLNVQSVYSKMGGNPSLQNNITVKQKETYEKGIALRKKEFKEYFDIGRTLVITSPVFYEYKYQIKEDPSRKGSLDIWECLNIDAPECSDNSGQNIETIDEDFARLFLKELKDLLSYSKRIDKSSGSPLFFIKDTKYVVGEYYKVGNGLILVLPDFKQPHGPLMKLFIEHVKNLSSGLFNLNLSPLLEFPKMVDQYITKGELKEQRNLVALLRKKKVIEEKIATQNSVLDNFKRIKLLFSSDGALLENACERIFLDFGFKIERPDGNRDDMIIKKSGHIGVIEIKGVGKSSAEKHSAQLQKWVSDYHLTHETNPKGILIVNTFKNLPIEARTEEDFPNQMMKYVNQMEHCLITGIQLLAIYLDFKNKILKIDDVLKILFETIGVVHYAQNIEEYIKKNEVPHEP